MKRWAVLTVLLYGVLLLLLSAPVICVCSLKWSTQPPTGWMFDLPFSEAMAVYKEWSFWIWITVLLGGQALLLLLPLDLSERRLKPRVHIIIPIVVSGFLLANLCLAGLLSLLVGLFNEAPLEAFFNFADLLFDNQVSMRALNAAGISGVSKDWPYFLLVFQMLGIFWLIWGFIFYRYAKNDLPEALLNRITKWLLRGSLLDLLVAVPSHVIVRSKTNCCAPMGSFWGIATGISIMLLTFGPGVFFLFVKRMSRLKPAGSSSRQDPKRQVDAPSPQG